MHAMGADAEEVSSVVGDPRRGGLEPLNAILHITDKYHIYKKKK